MTFTKLRLFLTISLVLLIAYDKIQSSSSSVNFVGSGEGGKGHHHSLSIRALNITPDLTSPGRHKDIAIQDINSNKSQLLDLTGSNSSPDIPPNLEEVGLTPNITESSEKDYNYSRFFENEHEDTSQISTSEKFRWKPENLNGIMKFREIEYQDYDGWYNNLASPYYGSPGTNLFRQTRAHYPMDGGVYQIPFHIDEPNPYEISRQLFKGPSGLPSFDNKTVLFVAFTSHLMNEIVNAHEPHCPREIIKVKVPKNHSLNPLSDGTVGNRKNGEKDFYTLYRRCAYNPRSGLSFNSPRILINKVTSFIDGSSIYGENRAWSQFLRSHKGGKLKYFSKKSKTQDVGVQHQYPALNLQGIPMKNIPPPTYQQPLAFQRLLMFGDDRTNESPLLLTMGILWFRWHNYLADIIWQKNPAWNDELIFNEARKWVIATYQKIVVDDWLPIMLGSKSKISIPDYNGYKPEINPAISVEFEALVSQYHYTMIPNGLYLGSKNCHQEGTARPTINRLCNLFWSPQTFLRHNLGDYLMGMSTQIAEREDRIFVEDFRSYYYGNLENSRRDFVVENILHSIDAGIPNYKSILKEFNLGPIESFDKFGDMSSTLHKIYGHIDKLDAWTGGILESKDGNPSQLFTKILTREIVRIRDGDRFWYEGYEKNGLFTTEEFNIIKKITFRDIVLSVTNIPEKSLQKNLFRWISGDPCSQIKQMEENDMNEECVPLKRYDYFAGSAISYIATFLFLGLFILSITMTMLIWANLKERVILKSIECRPITSKIKDPNITAQEWVRGDKFYGVILCLNPHNFSLNIYCEGKEPPSRLIKFDALTHLELYTCNNDSRNHELLLLKIPNEYDHIFSFNGNCSLLKFTRELKALCSLTRVHVKEQNVNSKEIFSKVFTKKDRQKQLELFFKTAFTKAFADNFDIINFNNNNSNIMMRSNTPSTNDCFEILDCNNNIIKLQQNKLSNKEKNDSYLGDGGSLANLFNYNESSSRSNTNNDTSFNSSSSNLRHGSTTFGTHAFHQRFSIPSYYSRFQSLFVRNSSFPQITASDRPETRDYCIRKISNPEARSIPLLSYERDIPQKKMEKIKSCELTRSEFAEALSLKEDSTFVENMFSLVDKDKNGRISFKEFLDFTIIFFKGSAEEKARVIFDMYDSEKNGHLTKENFKDMMESLMELSSIKINSPELTQGLNLLLNSADLNEKHLLSFHDFLNLLGDHKDEFEALHINWEGTKVGMPKQKKKKKLEDKSQFNVHTRRTIIKGYRNQCNGQTLLLSSDENHQISKEEPRKKLSALVNVKSPKMQNTRRRISIRTYKLNEPKGKLAQTAFLFVRYLENYRWHVFWSLLYTLIVIGIFLQKAYAYSFAMEHTGLRRIIGYGGSLSRGAASALMFCYSTILLTMCRNMITFLRETFLRHFIPFDAALPMHKYIAILGVIFTFLHIVGHALNFYHLSTQSPDDMLCMMRSFYHFSNDSPKFHNWLYGTITGISGVLLVMIMTIIYIFAFPYARKYLFNLFWKTHNLYMVFYILTFVHGLGMMLQTSIFAYFFLIPMILFILDKLISLSRKKSEIPIIRADVLPSHVTNLIFKKPPNFEYKSGQWVRIALTSQGSNEFHPFTLTSAPHEEHLSLHIRAVGPWTSNLRRTFDSNFLHRNPPPKVLLDGPFGEGHQDWDRFQVSVLIGGGIGVTPFASILKDIVQKSTLGTKMKCQKVYFLWITRTQKQFEWLTDIIRDVEEKDFKEFVSVNIFITQLYQKFDLRTAMLYICERHFYKVNDRSLFTGLKAITHFGRPDFVSFFMSLQEEHPDIYKFGVFSCGPPGMTHNVESATQVMNKLDQGAFIHHYENF